MGRSRVAVPRIAVGALLAMLLCSNPSCSKKEDEPKAGEAPKPASEAMAYVEAGRARGKVVVKVR
jgi:hypothetical protein